MNALTDTNRTQRCCYLCRCQDDHGFGHMTMTKVVVWSMFSRLDNDDYRHHQIITKQRHWCCHALKPINTVRLRYHRPAPLDITKQHDRPYTHEHTTSLVEPNVTTANQRRLRSLT